MKIDLREGKAPVLAHDSPPPPPPESLSNHGRSLGEPGAGRTGTSHTGLLLPALLSLFSRHGIKAAVLKACLKHQAQSDSLQ